MPEGQSSDPKFQGPSKVALTFDECCSGRRPPTCCRREVDIRSRVTRSICAQHADPVVGHGTVTEARLAIAMAQAGGIGVIHRNLDAARSRPSEVRQVKKFESGMVVNPVTIAPDGDARRRAEADGGSSASPASRWSSRRQRRPATASWSASSPTATCASPPIRTSRFTS